FSRPAGPTTSTLFPYTTLFRSYQAGVTDEFVKPVRIDYGDGVNTRVESGDAIIFFNFRADRARQLTRAFTEVGFDGFDRGEMLEDRKSTRLNSSHVKISYAVFC